MEGVEFEYQIGGKTYVQRKLVFGQVRQLTELLRGLIIPEGISEVELISILGPRLSKALAIVLTEKGKHPRDKDIDTLAKEIEFDISPETVIKVVEDFFVCNPIAFLIEESRRAFNNIANRITNVTKIISKSSSVSSQEETSPEETKSSGDIPLKKQNPISSTAREK